MANCEKCGATFTPSVERTEVSSLRVLCPKCEAERRAEKAARAAAATAAQAIAAGGAAKAAGTAGAARPAARAPAATPSAAARPAAARPAPARPAASQARDARAVAQGKDLHGAPSKKLLHKPITGATSAQGGEHYHPDVKREVEMLKQRESKVMTIAWVVCGVLVVAAGGVALAAKAKRDADTAAIEKHVKALEEFADKMQKFDLTKDEECEALLKFAEEQKGVFWEDDAKAGPLASGLISHAKSNLEASKEKRGQLERLANVEGALRDAASKSSVELRKHGRTLESLGLKAGMYGQDFDTRVAAARVTVDKTLVTKLREEAKTLAGGGADKVRAALTAYSQAEDEVTRLLDSVVRTKNEEAKQYATAQFKEILDESNQFVTSVFTQKVIDQTPWTDMLSVQQKPNWDGDGLGGWRIESEKLQATGPAVGAGKDGVLYVPKAGGYRDFDMEMEFTMTGGKVELCFRLGRRFDNTVESFPLTVGSNGGLKAGQNYMLKATYIGNKLTVTLDPPDANPLEIESNWTKVRKGAFGAVFHEGSGITITRLRIRELRNA
jgi:hypothetical protein